MTFACRIRVWLAFGISLIFCSVMVVLQMQANRSKYVELREAFTPLESKGCHPQGQRRCLKPLNQPGTLPDQALQDDCNRTRALINPAEMHGDDLIWNYHWTVSNAMDQRLINGLGNALNMAEGPWT